MNEKLRKTAFVSFVLITLLVLPGFVQAQKQKIRVTVEGASVRVKPDAASDVIASPEVGTIFEVQAKSEGWFEIRITTELGVTITGYIPEMYVETVEPEPQPAEPEKVAPEKVEPVPVQAEPKTARKTTEPAERSFRLSLRMGGMYGSMAGYDYSFSVTYYNEPLSFSESIAKTSAPGFHFELGVVLMKFFELTAGLNSYSKNMQGTYNLGLPNMYIYNDIVFDDETAEPSRKMTALDLGVNFHPLQRGPIRPYLGGGVSFVTAKVDLLEDIRYRETIYSDYSHTMTITEIQLVNKSVKKTGFYIRGGLYINVFGPVFVFAEGKYLIAKTDVLHPLTSSLSGYEDEKMTLDLGGVSGLLGFRVLL
jgi:opacity protein-like surface antigen